MNIPNHIAIIMDGNSRWAAKNSLPVSAGHKKGAETLKEIALSCKKLGLNYLTVYAFSTENWCRPKNEVMGLMSIFKLYLKHNIKDLMKENVQVRFIGDRDRIDSDLQKLMKQVEEQTKNNEFKFTIALSYGSREEIRNAAVNFAKNYDKNSSKPEDFDKYLYTNDLPDPDLFIRTSGEFRISNFLLWQLSYTELYFTDVLWPDFTEKHLLEAIEEYNKRNRRYGLR